jgi:adenine phosphoribosyltransferase
MDKIKIAIFCCIMFHLSVVYAGKKAHPVNLQQPGDNYKVEAHMTTEELRKFIKDVSDFPKKGIVFKDLSPLLKNIEAYNTSINMMAELISNSDLIVSPDARGFLFGPPISLKKNIPFAMIRKKGKLPGNLVSADYELEYGKNTLEMIDGIIIPGQKVAIVDDFLATGGTTNAIIELIKKQGGIVTDIVYLAEISSLNGKEKVNHPNKNIKSLISF